MGFLFVDSYNVRDSNVYIGLTDADVTSQPTCVTFGQPSGIPPGGSQTFNCSSWVVGRYVTIWKRTSGELLTVCEVIVSGYFLGV